ncbi:MAG: hypothetical protein JO276_03860 [Sphingomonadaceae bacterium]|nr:hypothetical protein [Sphingomonadaceae bacterium]
MIALTLAALLLTGPQSARPAAPPQLAPEIQEDLRLRARLGVHELASAWTIYVHSEAAHHLTEHYALVATRGADGRWTLISIGEESSGLLQVPTRALPEERRVLGAGDSQDLGRLLRWPALYRQPNPREREVGVGAAFHTMEIVTPRGHAVFRWAGRLRGWAGAVADMIMGRD